jgi:hypothetical protein
LRGVQTVKFGRSRRIKSILGPQKIIADDDHLFAEHISLYRFKERHAVSCPCLASPRATLEPADGMLQR